MNSASRREQRPPRAHGGALQAVVDEVAAYDFALTAQQIAALYSAAETQPQLHLRYDALNRVIGVSRASDGAAIAAYLYDANNRRVRKTITNGGLTGDIPNGTTDSLWQGWQTMEERNPFGGSGSTDTPTKQYIWGAYIDELIQLNLLESAGPQSLPAGAYYLLQDLLYRAVALTNSSGAIVEAYDCDAYGNTLIFTGPGADGVWFTDDDVQSNYGANGIIYCGYRFDAETQNYYVRNRTYNPALGRWIQRDPIGYEGGINLYEYVGSLAAAQADPSGFGGRTLPQPGGLGIHGGTGIIYRHGLPFPNNNNTSNANPRGYLGPRATAGAGCCESGGSDGQTSGVWYYGVGLEITVFGGGSFQAVYAWDACRNHCWVLMPSARLGLSVGAGTSGGYSMGCLADFLGYNAIGWDLTGGVGPFSLGLSGTWGKGATGAEGGIGIGFPDLKAGLSWGFADAAGAIPGLPCVTNRKCPCRSSAICKYELESTDPYLSGYTPGPNYYPYPF